MSGLTYICNYGYSSSSEESDSENDKKQIKKTKLPIPDLSKVAVITTDDNVIDNPLLHEGRTRSFPHIRGNWASFVYIKYPEESNLNELVNKLQNKVHTFETNCIKCDDFHISLSKTFVLQYHMIRTFTSSLQASLGESERFDLGFNSIKVYCNDEKTRTFVALEVDYFSNQSFLRITEKVDKVLADFKLPKFYDDPSFHMSILWINGNRKEELENIIEYLNEILGKEIGKTVKTVTIDKVFCKIGNKLFQFILE